MVKATATITLPDNYTYQVETKVNIDSKTIYFNIDDIPVGSKIEFDEMPMDKGEERREKEERPLSREKEILLFALSTSKPAILTASGKDYLVKNNLYSAFQLKLAQQNNIKYSSDTNNNLLSSYNRKKKKEETLRSNSFKRTRKQRQG